MTTIVSQMSWGDFHLSDENFSVGKKMPAVHFTTIPYEPYTADKVLGKPYFWNICPYANDIVYARFEDARTVLFVFISGVVEVFVS